MPGRAGMSVAGRYVLIEAVGQGGMGRVWRGHDQLLDRVVAVKEVILPPQSPRDHAEFLARTMREAQAAGRLDHPGVITIHDVVEDEGSPWIVMQFVSGSSLRAEIDRAGRLPWPQVADIGRQTADALAAAHAAGIVHRDLKPDNILLSGQRAIVTDFGIARIIDATTQLTGAGVLMGTPLYMSPEQLDGGNVGPAADMWALGATLYSAVEGKPPFDGTSMTALMAAILTGTPDRPQHAGPLLEVISALLSKNPAERPSAPAVARVLAAYRPGQPAGPLTSERPSPGRGHELGAATVTVPNPVLQPEYQGRTQPPGRSRWRHPVILLSAAVLAAVAGAGAILLPGHLRGSATPSPGHSTTPSASPSSRTTPKPTTASLVATLTDPVRDGQVLSMAFGPGGGLAVGDANGSTYLWDTATKSVSTTITDPQGQGPMSLAFRSDGTLAIVDSDNSTYIWNTATNSLITTLTDPGGGSPTSVAFGPEANLAIGDLNGSTYLWSTDTWRLVSTLSQRNLQAVDTVAFGSDGTLAVGDRTSADVNRNTYLWDPATKSLITTLPDPGGTGVETLALGPDGTLAAADTNGNTYLWNIATKRLLATLASRGGRPLAVAFGPDSTLAVGQANGSTLLWSTVTKHVIKTISDPGGKIIDALAFGPDGTLAVGDITGHTYVWRISGGKA